MKTYNAIGLLLMLCASHTALSAIPYHGTTYQYTQPNGEVITLSLDGNDYYAEQRTPSGRLAIYDKALKGMAYAKVAEDGESLESTGELISPHSESPHQVKISNRISNGTNTTRQKGLSRAIRKKIALENRKKIETIQGTAHTVKLATKARSSGTTTVRNTAAASRTISGDIHGLTVLIQFPDQRSTMSINQIKQFLNGETYNEFGNASSVRGFYRDVSGNKVNYTNTVTKYYTAAHNKSYYTDASVSYPKRAQELITEALNWLEKDRNFDFSTLSVDNNHFIRGLNIMYAGATDSAWSQGLWPHKGGLNPRFCADNVCTSGYQISNIGDSLSIGTFVHESGHLLFDWPDLYDYDGSSNGSVAGYGLMSYGANRSNGHKPVPPVAPLKALVGWENVTEINPAVNASAPTGKLSSTSESNQVYKWTNPKDKNEAFYIEAVYPSGHNSAQPGSGLLIYHVDGSNGARDNEWHPYIQLEHADGKRDPENSVNYGDKTDPYGEYGEFNATLPNALTAKGTNSRWWDGSDSGLDISDISQPAKTITFKLNSNPAGNHTHTGTTYTGSLAAHAQTVEPNGGYFWSDSGSVSGKLSGPSNADFGLVLFQWVDHAWKKVAESRKSRTSSELIRYRGKPAYYSFVVISDSGSGKYKLTTSGQAKN